MQRITFSRGREKELLMADLEVTKFTVGDYVILTHPNPPPNELAGIYWCLMVISVTDRLDLIKISDLITNRESLVHASRLCPKDMSLDHNG